MEDKLNKLKENIYKGILTTIFGCITLIIVLILVFMSKMTFVWNGVAGIVIGTVLLLSPDTLINEFGKLIDKFTNGKNDDTK